MALLFSLYFRNFIYKKYHVYKDTIFIIYVLIDIYSFLCNDLTFFFIFTFLISQAITDYINQDVLTTLNIIPIIYAIIINSNHLLTTILYASIFPFALLIINKFKTLIGMGDIEIIFVLGLYFKYEKLLLIVLISSLINLIYSFFVKKNKYSFVPFILIATFLVYFFI